MTQVRWKDDPARGALLGLYAEVDSLLAGHSCDASTDCCHFGRTGREPYPTAVEVAELEHAIAAVGGASSLGKTAAGGAGGKVKLTVLVDERRCPLLSAEGRCRVYASRPFGCRTFFCDRARSDSGRMPREKIQTLGRLVADLSARTFARDPGPRTLEAALDRIRGNQTVRVDRK